MFRAPLFEERERSYVVGLLAFPFSPRENRNRVLQPTNLKVNTHQWISSRDPLAYNMQLKIDSNHFEGWFPLTRFWLRTVTHVTRIEARYKVLRLNVKLSEVQLLRLRATVHACLYFICEHKFYARTHVKITRQWNQPWGMKKNSNKKLQKSAGGIQCWWFK